MGIGGGKCIYFPSSYSKYGVIVIHSLCPAAKSLGKRRSVELVFQLAPRPYTRARACLACPWCPLGFAPNKQRTLVGLRRRRRPSSDDDYVGGIMTGNRQYKVIIS